MNLLAIQDHASGHSAVAVPAASAPRSSASYARVRPQRSETFERTLQEVQGPSYTVRNGDTLSEIVHNRLRAMGERVSGTELYERVQLVAKANGISNPDVISVGQTIDLAVLDGRGGTAVSARPEPVYNIFGPPPVHEPVHGLHRIVPGQTRISSGFGPRQDPIDGTVREHRGIDIAARRGTPIFAAAEGIVVYAGRHGGHGKTVILRHSDGSETLYAHADQLLVKEGDRVGTTDRLGLVGSTGRSTGPHLHFEVRRNGEAVDPMAVYGAAD